jgi:hypothetical protein
MSVSVAGQWSPELVNLLKQTAVEARLGPGRLQLQIVRRDQFEITFEHRRVLVGIREDADGGLERAYWREAAPAPAPLAQQLVEAARATLPGSQPQPHAAPPREKLLDDGTRGYFVRAPRTDDCQAAAIATVLQVPIETVPDLRIDERLAAGGSPESIERSAVRELRAWLARPVCGWSCTASCRRALIVGSEWC